MKGFPKFYSAWSHDEPEVKECKRRRREETRNSNVDILMIFNDSVFVEFIIKEFVDRTRQAASNFGKMDLKRDVMKHQRKQRGKYLMQSSNSLSTKALMNLGIHEMRMKLFEQAVEKFTQVIKENGDHKEQAYLLRSKCLTM